MYTLHPEKTAAVEKILGKKKSSKPKPAVRPKPIPVRSVRSATTGSPLIDGIAQYLSKGR